MDMNSTTDEKSGIYMLVHPNSKHRYIGQTSNFKRRKREHWAELAKAMKGNKCDKKYRQMIKTPTPGLWIMAKLYVENHKYVKKAEYSRRVERKRLEKDYIARLRPTLNTMDTYSNNRPKKEKRKNRKGTKRHKGTKKLTYTKYVIKKDKRIYTTLNSIQKLYPLHERLHI